MTGLDRHLLDVAFGDAPADAVVANGQLVNVLTGEIYAADVALTGERIASVGPPGSFHHPDTEVIDAGGRFVVPGLIDGHQHLEDSRLSVTRFAEAVVPAGTTSIFSGLDHIVAVAGLDGLRLFLDEAESSPMSLFWGAPFRLPYTLPTSTIGFPFGPAEHEVVQQWSECIGVWELIPEFVVGRDAGTLAALDLAHRNGQPIFGSVPAAGEKLHEVTGMVAAGLRVDHEAFSPEELLEKLRLGLYVLIRDSPVEHFLEPLIGALIEQPQLAGRVAFCTDQMHAADVAAHGHIDRLVREAIGHGIPPVTAIQMATINCATIYRIDHLVGSVAPGRVAHLLFVDDLHDFRPSSVIAKGSLVATDGRMLASLVPPARPASISGPFTIADVEPDDLAVRVPEEWDRARVLVMELTHNAFVRHARPVELDVEAGVVVSDPGNDVAMVTVIERFGRKAQPPTVAFISGFGLSRGALASSSTPDDENIICVGTNPDDMALAVNTIARAGGGECVVADREVLGLHPLPVAGIVTDADPVTHARAERELDELLHGLGCELAFPWMFLGVLCTTAIPDYGITDGGLVDCVAHEYVDPVLGPVPVPDRPAPHR